MCKTKQGSKLVDMNSEYLITMDVEGKTHYISKKSVLQILADYVFEVDDSEVVSVLYKPEHWRAI